MRDKVFVRLGTPPWHTSSQDSRNNSCFMELWFDIATRRRPQAPNGTNHGCRSLPPHSGWQDTAKAKERMPGGSPQDRLEQARGTQISPPIPTILLRISAQIKADAPKNVRIGQSGLTGKLSSIPASQSGNDKRIAAKTRRMLQFFSGSSKARLPNAYLRSPDRPTLQSRNDCDKTLLSAR
jgi:hypothetical protein